MFYAHFVLSKKGPLARIWLAAHWDKKLTRAHVFETNITSSVEAILEPKVKMALRTSGHLLLGVVRIYSRKAKYLLADCNEAFVKIKMAFRPGVVDLPEDANREAAIAAITLPDNLQDFETTIADLNELDVNAITANQSRPEDITMREDFGEINLGRQDDDFGEATGYEEASSHESYRDANMSDARLSHREPGSLSIRDMTTGSSVGQRGSGAGERRSERARGGRNEEKVVESEVVNDDDDDDDLGGGFLDAGDDDDDDNFGGEIDDGLLADADLFGDPAVGQHLERLTSEIESQMMSGQEMDTAQHPSELSTGPVPPREHTTLLTNESEAFALPPIDASSVVGSEVRSRVPKRKRRLIIDEQKSIPSEVMKVQMTDTSDITTALDLAPPTKKLMQWKETGGVDRLLAMPGRAIASRGLMRLFTRNLRSLILPDDAPEELSAIDSPAARARRESGQQDEGHRSADAEGFVPPAPVGQTSGGHRHVMFAGDSGMSAIDEANESAGGFQVQQNRMTDLDSSGGPLRNDPFLLGLPGTPAYPTEEPSTLDPFLQPETPYLAPPSVLSEAPPSVLQPDMLPLDREFDEEVEPGGEPGDPTDEGYEERRLEKRSKVMLRMLTTGLHSEGDMASFQVLAQGNTKKQAAAKFYTILLLRKQGAVELSQREPFSDIFIGRGPNFSHLIHSSSA